MLELNFDSPSKKLEGFVYGLDDKEYRKAKGISQSSIKTLITEPFKYFNKVEESSSEAMIEGTLLHLLFSEPEKLYEKFFISDSKGIEKRDILKDEIAGRIPYPIDKLKRLQDCVEYVKLKMIERYGCDLDAMDGEVSYFGEFNGLPAKARADKITDDRKAVFDFKKCKSSKPKEFLNTACNLHYGIQEYFYRELMGLEDFVWIAIETEPLRVNGNEVFMFRLFRASELMREQSKRDIDRAYEVLKKKDIFKEPIYPDEFIENSLESGLHTICELVPPLWKQH